MTYEKDPFELEEIPDYALQPAKDADEYNFHYVPRGAAGRFDPAAYEKVLYDSVRQAAESKEQSEMLEEILPVAFSDANQGEPSGDQLEPVSAAEPLAEQPEMEAEAISVMEGTPEAEEEELPVFLKPAATRPVFQPAFVPKIVPAKIIPMIGTTVSSKLKLVDMKRKEPFRVTIEEDILVPDVKPDLARILVMDGTVKLIEREIHTGQAGTDSIRLLGDLILETLYVPEHTAGGEPIVSIESKIPFKNETELKAGPYSDLTIIPAIESIDYTIVNERKFRVKTAVVFGVREYSNVDVEVFEGVKDEEVQMLKEKINLTDVAVRKREPVEIKEDLALKDTMPEILKILKHQVSVVENHKQITKEKAVINASVYCNVMYLGAEIKADPMKAEENGVNLEEEAIPVLYQGKTEFTQFIRLDGENVSGEQNQAGSKASFDIKTLSLTAKEDANGKRNLIGLDMNVETGLELYKNMEKEVVTDVYHHRKDLQFETDEIGAMALSGSGSAEISAREIVNIPERYGNVDKIAYISGNISEKRTSIDQNKCVTEGVVTVSLICTSADTKKSAFSITQEIPYRSAVEIPGITPDMTVDNDTVLKELWFDKINNKQIEVNAGILVNTSITSQKKHQLVKNVSFLESPQQAGQLPGIVLYIARPEDTIWKIAKKYRTTIDELKKINDLEVGKEIKPGTKLLIVAKND